MIRIKNNITPRLPNEYQELEYIQSTGTQCIDTGIPLNQYRKCEMEFSPTSIGTMQIIDGGYTNTSEQDDTRNYLRIDSDGMLNLQYAGSNTSYKLSSVVIASNTKYAISYKMLASSCSLTVNGTEYSNLIGVTLITNGNNVFLFGESFKDKNLTKTYEASALIKLYTAKYYDSNGILIRNFIPCYRKLDNEIGLYDLVNNQFYINAGTGVFLMGTEVNKADVNLKPIIGNKKVLKRYIGENLVYGKETPNYEQKINYTMLYDYGDECTDITGGWSIYGKYSSPTISKNTDHLYINISSGWQTGAFGMTNSIDLTNFTCLLSLYKGKSSVTTKVITVQTSKATNSTYGSLDNVTGRISYLELPYTTASQSYLKSIDLSNVEGNYFINCGLNIGTGNSGSLSVYVLALVKEDDCQTLANLAGITATSIDDILTNSTTLLSNKKAVEFMIYNCTGDFMASAIQSETFLTALNNSQYKTIVQANEHWNKFLNMVS